MDEEERQNGSSGQTEKFKSAAAIALAPMICAISLTACGSGGKKPSAGKDAPEQSQQVTPKKSEKSPPRKVYYGLPVTTAVLIVLALMGLARLYRWPLQILAPSVLLVMGGLFLTPFPLKKPALFGKIGMLLWGGVSFLILLAGVDL